MAQLPAEYFNDVVVVVFVTRFVSFPFHVCSYYESIYKHIGRHPFQWLLWFGGVSNPSQYFSDAYIIHYTVSENEEMVGLFMLHTHSSTHPMPIQLTKKAKQENNFPTCFSPINNSFIFTKTNYTHYLSRSELYVSSHPENLFVLRVCVWFAFHAIATALLGCTVYLLDVTV